ncbi:hypothetical protein MKW92_031767 [Papaver armeniacum]|nr:hypothetical protein MKW92_031767 [Papaver armeniacum]
MEENQSNHPLNRRTPNIVAQNKHAQSISRKSDSNDLPAFDTTMHFQIDFTNTDRILSLPSLQSSLKTLSDFKETLESVNTGLLPEKTGINSPQLRKIRATCRFADKLREFKRGRLNLCEVRVNGFSRVLYIHKLRDCRVYVGLETDYYLHVCCRSITEDCNTVRFALYLLCYKGIDKDLKIEVFIKILEMGNVADFKWLGAVQTPNWSTIPEEERVNAVNISNLVTPTEDILDVVC